MDTLLSALSTRGITPISVDEPYPDEVHITIEPSHFLAACCEIHTALRSPVMALFAVDAAPRDVFFIHCVFLDVHQKKWIFVTITIAKSYPSFPSLSSSIYSAHLFEREIKEMFGITPMDNPDTRRLRLHDEVWQEGYYPLRKDFEQPRRDAASQSSGTQQMYHFTQGKGVGMFELPVGPIHAGVIGPGHFHFSVAGEPVINCEARFGFTHRGVEKIFEGKHVHDAVRLAECVAGDTSVSHSLALCHAVEKIAGIEVPERGHYLRAIFLELERMYNHVSSISGIAADTGFSFAASYAALIKETLLQCNDALAGHRFLKGVNTCGGVLCDISDEKKDVLCEVMHRVHTDIQDLKKILYTNDSFMDRVEKTGILKKNVAEDFGVLGVVARASGIPHDLRKLFPCVYQTIPFGVALEQTGDVRARLAVRFHELAMSYRMILQLCATLPSGNVIASPVPRIPEGAALGYVEAARGPVVYWVATAEDGTITRCKIVDPSFHNWDALSLVMSDEIIPDFPLCNKSFDLSYAGNDL